MSSSFADRLRAGESLSGVWSGSGSQPVVETLAYDFDFVVIDGEHSEVTIDEFGGLVRAVDATDTDAAPVVRVSESNSAEIRRVLDLDPCGVIVPQIETVEEARDAIAATNYPPEGIRGVAGSRASEYGRSLPEYYETANETIATILQVETASLVEDIESVAALDGLDALFIGPADLSARLGCFGEYESEQFRSVIEKIISAANDASVPVGTLATGAETIERRHGWGVDFMALGTDLGHLQRAATEFTEKYDSVLDGPESNPTG